MGVRSHWKYSRPQIVVGVSVIYFFGFLQILIHFLGLRCLEPLLKGQFIDTYRGEIITNDEANLRGQQRNNNQNNYLMDLDKFTRRKFITEDELKELVSADEFEDILLRAERDDYETKTSRNGKVEYLSPDYKPPYVCDGQESGGPTKFMNHSCQPNCRLFTASYNHSDTDVYDLAFFTLKAISKGTELTFDYLDEEDRAVITDERADEMEKEQGYRPMRCLCGSPSCRRYFFN